MEAGSYGRRPASPVRRLTTETKQAFKTTEFAAYVLILLGLFIAGLVVGSDGEEGGFGAEQVWQYATILTVGYMISRGLAKAGSRDPYWDNPDAGHDSGDGLGDRVKAAAQVIKDGPDAAQGGTTGTGSTEAPTQRF
jgi:hypothetical protein